MKTGSYALCAAAILVYLLLAGIGGDPSPSGGAPALANLLSPATALAAEDWKKEFEEICSRTADAMGFSKEELKILIDRCEKLKPLIEKLDATERKVYGRRLQQCRDLLAFVLESKKD